jgi:hypothetical protein
MTDASRDHICLRGARQNNLKNLDLDIPLNELTSPGCPAQASSLVFIRLWGSAATSRSSALRAAPRSHGQATQIGSIRHPAGVAIDQTNGATSRLHRHDDRAQRSPEAAVRASARSPRGRCARTAPSIYADLSARARAAWTRAPSPPEYRCRRTSARRGARAAERRARATSASRLGRARTPPAVRGEKRGRARRPRRRSR